MILALNLTEYMGPDREGIESYANTVDQAIQAGKLSGPFTTACPECGSDFADVDEAHEDTEHIIVTLTSDTFAVVVACEGYFVVNPNLVGIDSPNWMGPEDEATIITPDGVFPGTPGAPVIVTSHQEIEDRMRD